MSKYNTKSLWRSSEIIDPEEWSKEAYDLAIKYAYNGIKENQTPSEQYINRRQEIASR